MHTFDNHYVADCLLAVVIVDILAFVLEVNFELYALGFLYEHGHVLALVELQVVLGLIEQLLFALDPVVQQLFVLLAELAQVGLALAELVPIVLVGPGLIALALEE